MNYVYRCELVIHGKVRVLAIRQLRKMRNGTYTVLLDDVEVGTTSKDDPDPRKKAWTCIHSETKEPFGGSTLLAASLHMINTVFRR